MGFPLRYLEAWVRRERPAPAALEMLLDGIQRAKYGLSGTFVERLNFLLL